jgi:Rieske Fe-S protein
MTPAPIGLKFPYPRLDVAREGIGNLALFTDEMHRIIGCMAHADQYATCHRRAAVHTGPAMSKNSRAFFDNR